MPRNSARRLLSARTTVLMRMDFAFYGLPSKRATLAGGAEVSVTAKMTTTIKATIRWKLITVPSRSASTARRTVLHLPRACEVPWDDARTNLFNRANDPPVPVAA